MKPAIKYTVAATAIAVLAACGGGGEGGTNSGSTANNPLSKYEGTYYVCDGRSKETMTVTAVGDNTLSFTLVENIYDGDNCTGSVVGTYTLPQPLSATYQSQTSVTLPPVTVLPISATVDKVTLSSPSMTAQLSGSGVRGSCVYYTNGNVCYDSLSLASVTTTGAVYQNGNYILTFSLENGVLEADGIYSKDAAFNVNSLRQR